jgi:hypothetical protein
LAIFSAISVVLQNLQSFSLVFFSTRLLRIVLC